MNENKKPDLSKRFEGHRVAIVAASWHTQIVASLVEAAKETVTQTTGIEPSVYHVPGSYELPQAVYMIAKTQQYDAIVPLGCIIRGETSHFDFIAQTIFSALDQIGRETRTPISIGVLTTENLEQAIERSGGNKGNKGTEAALAALELSEFKRKIL